MPGYSNQVRGDRLTKSNFTFLMAHQDFGEFAFGGGLIVYVDIRTAMAEIRYTLREHAAILGCIA